MSSVEVKNNVELSIPASDKLGNKETNKVATIVAIKEAEIGTKSIHPTNEIDKAELCATESVVDTNVVDKMDQMCFGIAMLIHLIKDPQFRNLMEELKIEYQAGIVTPQNLEQFNAVVDNKIAKIDEPFKDKIITTVNRLLAINNVDSVDGDDYATTQITSLGMALALIFQILYKLQVANSQIDSDILKAQNSYYKDFVATLTNALDKYNDIERQQNDAAKQKIVGAFVGLGFATLSLSVGFFGGLHYKNSNIEKMSHEANELKSTVDNAKQSVSVINQSKLSNLDVMEILDGQKTHFKKTTPKSFYTIEELATHLTPAEKELADITDKINTKSTEISTNTNTNTNTTTQLNNELTTLKLEKTNKELEIKNIQDTQKLTEKQHSLKSKLDEKYTNMDKLKDEILAYDPKDPQYKKNTFHKLNTEALTKLVEDNKDLRSINFDDILNKLNRDPTLLTEEELTNLYKLQKLNEFNKNNTQFYARFKEVSKHYEHQGAAMRNFADLFNNMARSLPMLLEAFAEFKTAAATKEQNTIQAEISKSQSLNALHNSYIDNRMKSKESIVDQLINLIFQLMQELGSLSRA